MTGRRATLGRARRSPPRVDAFLRPAIVAVLLLGAALSTPAAAHGGVVLGRLTTAPDPPRAGVDVELTVELEDADGMPIEAAILDYTVRSPSGTTTNVASVEDLGDGVYGAIWRPTETGVHAVTLVDRTDVDEAVAQTVELDVGASEPLAPRDMIFAPTASAGGASLRTWIVWLLAVPAGVAAIVVGLSLVVQPVPDDADAAGPEDPGSAPGP